MDNNIYEEGMAPEVQEQVPAEGKKDFVATVKGLLEKGKVLAASLIEKAKTLPKKVWIIGGSALVAVIALIVVLVALSNTYKTPIQTMEKYANAKKAGNMYDEALDMLNGFCEDEYKAIIKIMKKADSYNDNKEDYEDRFEESLQEKKDEYGDNFKVTYKVTEKEKLEKEDLKEFRDTMRTRGEAMNQMYGDMDSDDYEEFGEFLGITKSQAKDLVKQMKAIAKNYKTAKVSDGYTLTVVRTITGSQLDEPEEEEFDINVYKVDGRWVTEDVLNMDF